MTRYPVQQNWLILVSLVILGMYLPACSANSVSGATVVTVESTITDTPHIPSATVTRLAKTKVPEDQVLPVLTPTPTATSLPCGEDWCISPGHFILQRPINSQYNDYVERSYPFGSTLNGERDPHHGVEFINSRGVPVQAAADGVVVAAGTDHLIEYGNGIDFYGNLVVVEHHLDPFPSPIFTLYGHLDTVQVQVGQSVAAGDVLGTVGKSGKAMGMHLHFEVRTNGGSYTDVHNPELWFPPHAGNGVLVGRIINPEGQPRYFPDVKVQLITNAKKPPTYLPEPYADPFLPEDEQFHEVFVIGDLPAGMYRVSFTPPGVNQVMDVQVLPGMVTQVVLHAKY